MVLIQNLVFNNIARLLCGSGLTLRDFPSILYLILRGFISLIPLPKAFSCFSVSCSPPAFIPSLISLFHCCILLHSILQALSPEAKKEKSAISLSFCLSVSLYASHFHGFREIREILITQSQLILTASANHRSVKILISGLKMWSWQVILFLSQKFILF